MQRMTEESTRPRRRPTAARLMLSPSPSSPAAARRFIHESTAAWSLPQPVSEQLALIGSELVTNAVLHARTPVSVVLELFHDRIRVSVQDKSSAPATVHHYRSDALTGRGLALVAAASHDWGITRAPDGKVVWAALDLTGNHAAATSDRPDRRLAAAAAPAGRPGNRPIRFAGVPVQGYLDLQAHNDALLRELELIRIELEAWGGAASHRSLRVVGLIDELFGQFRGLRDGYRDVVASAQARGEQTVDLEASASPASVPAARAYVGLLEQADEFCRTGELLTPPPPAHVTALRRWFVAQMAAQLGDDPARSG
jgi:hypothetical protein